MKSIAIRYLSLLFCTVFLLFSSVAMAQTAPNPEKIFFMDEKGKKFTLADLKDRHIIIHYWATWCGPCIKELPELARFYNSLGDVRNSPIVILPIISSDRKNNDDVRKFLNKNGGYKLPFYRAGPELDAYLSAFGIRVGALPTSVFMTTGNRPTKTMPGAIPWDDPEIRKMVTGK